MIQTIEKPEMQENKIRLSRMLKALGNPIRFQIMEKLSEWQTCITNDVVMATALAQSTVSRHLKVLREAGLIRGEIEGAATCYCIDPEGVRFLKEQIGAWLPTCCDPVSMTTASSEYFDKVAGQWDAIRAGYFTEAVRDAAIQRAYLRGEMVAADVGAGTGFMTAGIAPRVRQVYALDGSQAMLDVARKNLSAFDNVIFRQADGASLPLPDASVDVVFANMFLHHIPEPLAAIREMARLLRPGGRLVITDMDSHPYTWFREEMTDVWLGFERPQIREWLEQAGLVNIIVDCSGQSCRAEPHSTAIGDNADRTAHVSIFLAVGARRVEGVRDAVQADYGAAALNHAGCCAPGDAGGSCCDQSAMSLIRMDDHAANKAAGSAGSCCSAPDLISPDCLTDPAALNNGVTFKPNYSSTEQRAVPEEAAALALGCGNPTAFAGIRPGEVVLDIGSGAGMDAFLAAQQVGPGGKVIGVDMTPTMLERARRSAEKAGLSQVEFRQGHAEALPVDDATVDVVISNCVINLTEDKGRVLRDAFRVLKPGGRLEVSDMVTSAAFPPEMRANPEGWPGCVFGALPEQEYLDLVAQAGFIDIHAHRSASSGYEAGVEVYSLAVSARKGGKTE